MLSTEFDYELDESSIAQAPPERREDARLLVDAGTSVVHTTVAALADQVGPGDLIVVNDTRVLPARLEMQKPTGGRVEVLVLDPVDGSVAEAHEWTALLRPARRLRVGSTLCLDGQEVAEVVALADDGPARVRFSIPVRQVLQAHGRTPLPPYVRAPVDDPDRYQTVYARAEGSVAAPTAGLHLTDDLLDRCRAAGAGVATVDLAVGLGTFSPIHAARIEDHEMHAERYAVPEATVTACRNADRVLAVGTTVVRALESWAATGRTSGTTALFIRRGFDFAVVDRLLTNFHVPRSSLLVLLDAFIGDRWRVLYEEARREGYRFLSFGDAMLVERSGVAT